MEVCYYLPTKENRWRKRVYHKWMKIAFIPYTQIDSQSIVILKCQYCGKEKIPSINKVLL